MENQQLCFEGFSHLIGIKEATGAATLTPAEATKYETKILATITSMPNLAAWLNGGEYTC